MSRRTCACRRSNFPPCTTAHHRPPPLSLSCQEKAVPLLFGVVLAMIMANTTTGTYNVRGRGRRGGLPPHRTTKCPPRHQCPPPPPVPASTAATTTSASSSGSSSSTAAAAAAAAAAATNCPPHPDRRTPNTSTTSAPTVPRWNTVDGSQEARTYASVPKIKCR